MIKSGKGTGKYYSPVYRAKKSPAKIKRTKRIKHILLTGIAMVAVATGIIAWQLNRSSNSFIEFTASQQLGNVETYPRLVNKANPIDMSYEPQNLVSLNTVPNGQSILLRSDAAESFISMLSSMTDDGLAVIPVKGYTSYLEQTNTLEKSIDQFIAEGMSSQEAAERTSSRFFTPGTNESQLGTSVDVSTQTNSVENFASTEQYQWLCNNAHKFGFIIRYTADKQNITGVEAQPWHLRFVGVKAAGYMKSADLCLEEYIDRVINDCPTATEEK